MDIWPGDPGSSSECRMLFLTGFCLDLHINLWNDWLFFIYKYNFWESNSIFYFEKKYEILIELKIHEFDFKTWYLICASNSTSDDVYLSLIRWNLIFSLLKDLKSIAKVEAAIMQLITFLFND